MLSPLPRAGGRTRAPGGAAGPDPVLQHRGRAGHHPPPQRAQHRSQGAPHPRHAGPGPLPGLGERAQRLLRGGAGAPGGAALLRPV